MQPSPDQRRRLPALLVALAILTGLVDAVSFLGLGRVFVANMTGNVVLLAFALAGAPGLSADLSALALAGFLAGAVITGRIGTVTIIGGRRFSWLIIAMAAQTGLMAGALIAALVTQGLGTEPEIPEIPEARPYTVILPLALAMGLQHATARRMAVPDIRTNVLTSTLTGIIIDSRLGGGMGRGGARRFAGPVAMFAGALIGGLCLLHLGRIVPLVVATGTVTGCLIATVTGTVAAP
ncbi:MULTISPECIES: YoaK family protein [unclassified Frankia]